MSFRADIYIKPIDRPIQKYASKAMCHGIFASTVKFRREFIKVPYTILRNKKIVKEFMECLNVFNSEEFPISLNQDKEELTPGVFKKNVLTYECGKVKDSPSGKHSLHKYEMLRSLALYKGLREKFLEVKNLFPAMDMYDLYYLAHQETVGTQREKTWNTSYDPMPDAYVKYVSKKQIDEFLLEKSKNISTNIQHLWYLNGKKQYDFSKLKNKPLSSQLRKKDIYYESIIMIEVPGGNVLNKKLGYLYNGRVFRTSGLRYGKYEIQNYYNQNEIIRIDKKYFKSLLKIKI